MEGFAARYHECNPKTFSHEDTGYILSVAIIMLNTDAHNDNIKEDKKMSKEEFINNCRYVVVFFYYYYYFKKIEKKTKIHFFFWNKKSNKISFFQLFFF